MTDELKRVSITPPNSDLSERLRNMAAESLSHEPFDLVYEAADALDAKDVEIAYGVSQDIAHLHYLLREKDAEHKKNELMWWDEKGDLEGQLCEKDAEIERLQDEFIAKAGDKAMARITQLQADNEHLRAVLEADIKKHYEAGYDAAVDFYADAGENCEDSLRDYLAIQHKDPDDRPALQRSVDHVDEQLDGLSEALAQHKDPDDQENEE